MSRTPNRLYAEFASLLAAIRNCEKSGNTEWNEKHRDAVSALCDLLPSGSGIDAGTKFDLDASTPNRLVFTFGFHHMNENGMYDGWTEHTLIVTPDLAFGVDLRITGRDRNAIKEYLHEVYAHVLTCYVWQDENRNWFNSIYHADKYKELSRAVA